MLTYTCTYKHVVRAVNSNCMVAKDSKRLQVDSEDSTAVQADLSLRWVHMQYSRQCCAVLGSNMKKRNKYTSTTSHLNSGLNGAGNSERGHSGAFVP